MCSSYPAMKSYDILRLEGKSSYRRVSAHTQDYMENTQMNPDQPQLQLRSIATACAVLDVSRSTVNALIHDGQLQTVKIGRLVRIPDQSLRDFVASLGGGDSSHESQPIGSGN